MKRRWIIRSFSIGLLLLCMGEWLPSYFRAVGISYRRFDGSTLPVGRFDEPLIAELGVAVGGGNLALYRWNYTDQPLGWRFACKPFVRGGSPSEISWGDSARFNLAGVKFFYLDPCWEVQIPFWLLSFGFAALLWFAWRKTRRPVKG